MGCKCAKITDEYHGYECEIMGGACMFLHPDSKRCAELYGEGPDAYSENEEEVESEETILFEDEIFDEEGVE